MAKIKLKWVGMVTIESECDADDPTILPIDKIKEKAKTVKDLVSNDLKSSFDASVTVEQQFCDVWRVDDA